MIGGGRMGPSGPPHPAAPGGQSWSPPCLLFFNACPHKLNTTAPSLNEPAWDGCALQTGPCPEEASQTRAEAKLGESSAGTQGSCTRSCPSKSETAPEIHGTKSAGDSMTVWHRLQMPRKLPVLVV